MAQIGMGDDASTSVDETQQLSKGSTSVHLGSRATVQAHLLQELQLLLKLMLFSSSHYMHFLLTCMSELHTFLAQTASLAIHGQCSFGF